MISRVVEIASPAALVLKDRQVRLSREDGPTATVPIEDLGVLLVDHAQVTFTAPLLAALAEANVAVVVCDGKHLPVGLLSPLEGNSLHAKTVRAQAEVALPIRKRLWQAVVQAKIREQARLLVERTGGDSGVTALVPFVRSGDPDNVEARAARAYFVALFGDDFVRLRDRPGINAMLNYGYAVLRAAVARAVVGAGLHPALGVHHKNQYNPFALADDLLEPLRPLVDGVVCSLVSDGGAPDELDSETRHVLLGVLGASVEFDEKTYPIMTALPLYAACARACLVERALRLPCPGRPISAG